MQRGRCTSNTWRRIHVDLSLRHYRELHARVRAVERMWPCPVCGKYIQKKNIVFNGISYFRMKCRLNEIKSTYIWPLSGRLTRTSVLNSSRASFSIVEPLSQPFPLPCTVCWIPNTLAAWSTDIHKMSFNWELANAHYDNKKSKEKLKQSLGLPIDRKKTI